MINIEVDLAIIGGGPAGQKGAIQGAKSDKRVAIVDRLGVMGGASLNQGTIPSKTLRSAILDLTGYQQSKYYGHTQKTVEEISVEDLTERINKVIHDESSDLEEQCKRNGIELVYGQARFANSHTLEVLNGQGAMTHCIIAEKILIASGSRPRHPIHIPDNNELFMDSDLVFRLKKLPEDLIVLGAGVVGCEYATMFAALGVPVTLLDRRTGVLRMLDSEISRSLYEYMEQIGINIKLGADIADLRCAADGRAEIRFKDGTSISASCVFYSMGRIANLDGMELDKAGVELDELGNIIVNPLFQTSYPNIYAAGDVIGPPGLASTSIEQGRLAVRNAFLMKSHHFPEFFPFGIYTIPEISSVGPTEEDLKKRNIHYEIGRARYSEIARGPIAGDTTGLIKMIFHAETLQVLSVHIIGTNATELIAMGQMALDFRVTMDYFVNTIFNYPTFAEGFRIAALNGLNKISSDGSNF